MVRGKLSGPCPNSRADFRHRLSRKPISPNLPGLKRRNTLSSEFIPTSEGDVLMEDTPDIDINLFIGARMSYDVECEKMPPKRRNARASLSCLCKARLERNWRKKSRRMELRMLVNMLGMFSLHFVIKADSLALNLKRVKRMSFQKEHYEL